MTIAELKKELNKFPDNWTITIVLGTNEIMLPGGQYEVTGVEGFDENEAEISVQTLYLLDEKGDSI